MSPNTPGNDAKHSGGMPSNIPGNVCCCFWVWCKSRELGDRRSQRFPCVTPAMESFSSDLLQSVISYRAESHLESCQASTMELFSSSNDLNTLAISAKKLHRRCSTGFLMGLPLEVL